MKVTGTDLSAGQFRALGNELAIRIPAIIERAGDDVLARTEDPVLRKRALLWKIEGTAAFHQALFRPDSLGAAVETYALSVQLEDWASGSGASKYYGDLQPFIAEGARRVRREVEEHALAVVKDRASAQSRWNKIATWAHENPIDENMSTRPSLHSVLATIAANQDVGMSDAFAGITANVADLATRVDVYAWTLPKVARWQAELAGIEMTSVDPGKLAVATLQRANVLLTRLDGLISPGGVSQLSAAAATSLRGERVAVMNGIDRQRRELMEQLAREREAVLGNVDGQRLATLADLDRKIERTLQGFDGIVTRMLWRGTLAIAGLMLLGALLGYLLLRARRAPRSS